MTDEHSDHTEILIREAFAAEAARAPDPRPVLAAVARGRSRRRPVLAVVAAAVVIAVTAVVVPQLVQRSTAPAPPGGGTDRTVGAVTEQNILVAGTDSHGRTDTMMMVHLAPDGSGAVLSLPRDSWVTVPGHGERRLNAVDEEFGTEALRETVAGLTGLTVDHYAILPMTNLAVLVDAVGGVTVCLRAPTTDPLTGASWPAGDLTLDGHHALVYLRQRHGLDDNELDRIVRHQAFLDGLARKMAEEDVDLAELLSALTAQARIDPGWDLVGAAGELRNVRPEELVFGTIPFHEPFTSPEGGLVLRVERAEVRAFVADALSAKPTATPVQPPPTGGTVAKDIGCVD